MSRAHFVRTALLLSATLVATATLPAQERKGDSLFTTARYFDLEQVSDPQLSPDGSRIVYTRQFIDQLTDRWEPSLWIMAADGSRNRYLGRGSQPRWSPDGTRILYLASPERASGVPDSAITAQLFVRWMDGEGAISQVTRVTSPIAGAEWAPDGRSIGFTMLVPATSQLRIDMPDAPRGAHWTEPPRYVDRMHYRFDRRGYLQPGYRHLFIVPADGGSPRQVTHGNWNVGYANEGEAASANWDWTPDGRTIVFDARDSTAQRSYRAGVILAVDVNTGVLRRVTPQRGAWTNPEVSPDGRRVAFTGFPDQRVSYKAGDLYVANLDGSGVTKLTGALDRDPSNVTWARDGSGLFFFAADQGASNIYFASTAGAVRRVTSGAHQLSLASVAGQVAAGVRSAPKQPPEIVRVDLRGGGVSQLTHVNDDLLARVTLGDVEELWYQSGSTRVQGWIVKPPDFQPGRRYPMIMEIHGGPHGMYGVGFNPMFQNFAANGFVVLYVNPRGSTGYGSAFGNAIENDYPGVDYGDLMAGVDATIGRGMVDTTRMYVGGCSGGGVLSSWVIGHTNRFAAAAVRCPVINWISMAGQTDIPLFTYNFFAKPFWEAPEEWLRHSSLMYVGNVTTPTMVMTGELDLRTPMPQSEEYFAALQMRGVPSALVRFNGEYHGTGSRPSNWIRTQLYMMRWYENWMRASPTRAQPVAEGTSGAGR